MDDLFPSTGNENTSKEVPANTSDEVESTSDEVTDIKEVKKSRRPLISKNSHEMSAQGTEVAQRIRALPYILNRFTWDDLKKKAEDLFNSLQKKTDANVSRSPLTYKLGLIFKEAKTSGGRVKHYLKSDLNKKEAEKNYGKFGYEYDSKSGYVFPNRQEEFMAAMEIMQEGIVEFGYETREFGLEYWTNLLDNYKQTIKDAADEDTNSSTEVGESGVLKAEVKSMLTSIIRLVEAEEPETYERTLRNLGFRREKNA